MRGSGRRTVLVADARLHEALKRVVQSSGDLVCFSDCELSAALTTIRRERPEIVAFESSFLESAHGRAFKARVEAVSLPGYEFRVVTAPTGASLREMPTDAARATTTCLNTRRVPRIAVPNPIDAIINGSTARLVNISALGIQVISEPVMRPNERLRVDLPLDSRRPLRVEGTVAWSAFEKPRNVLTPYYRAGLEFGSAATQELEEYCARLEGRSLDDGPAVG